MKERAQMPNNICGVSPQKVSAQFKDCRSLSYTKRYMLHSDINEFILIKQIQNFPQRKDLRRVSLGNLKCYKDVKQSAVTEAKLNRASHFLYHNEDVYPAFASQLKRQDEQERIITEKMARKMEREFAEMGSKPTSPQNRGGGKAPSTMFDLQDSK